MGELRAQQGRDSVLQNCQQKKSEPKFSSEALKFKDYEECNKQLNKILSEITDTQINYYRKEETQLLLCEKLFYLSENDIQLALSLCEEIDKMINSLIKKQKSFI